MFLRATTRKKDGKVHRYWSIVENRRLAGGRGLQRHVLYLGEITASQQRAWRRSVAVFDERAEASRSLALCPEDRKGVVDDTVVRLCLSRLRLPASDAAGAAADAERAVALNDAALARLRAERDAVDPRGRWERQWKGGGDRWPRGAAGERARYPAERPDGATQPCRGAPRPTPRHSAVRRPPC